jgi:hypothetical protein
MHGLRHTYARNRLDAGVDRKGFQWVKEAVDTVHGELGHGKGR